MDIHNTDGVEIPTQCIHRGRPFGDPGSRGGGEAAVALVTNEKGHSSMTLTILKGTNKHHNGHMGPEFANWIND